MVGFQIPTVFQFHNISLLSAKQSSKASKEQPGSAEILAKEQSIAAEVLALQTQCNGASEALKAIVRHFGDNLLIKLSAFAEWTVGAVIKANSIPVQGNLLEEDTVVT